MTVPIRHRVPQSHISGRPMHFLTCLAQPKRPRTILTGAGKPAYCFLLKGICMRKTIAAASVGLLLIAGQAVAAGNNSAVERVGDRVGARAEASNDFMGIPLPVLLIGTAVLVGVISVASDDDAPTSP